MADSNTEEMAVEAIVILNAAFTNIRLYPPTSDMIGNSIDRAYTVLQAIIEQEDSVVFAESEGNLIISGQMLNEANKKKPQVNAFVKFMINLTIKSISFEKGLKKDEILAFLEVVTRKPEDLEKDGGIPKVMATKGIQHIHVDRKLFVSMDKDQRIVSAGEVRDDGSQLHIGADAAGKGIDKPDDERGSGRDQVPGAGTDHPAKVDPEEKKEEERKNRLLRIQNGINSMLKGDDKAFMDPEVMRSLPPTILRMLSQGKEKNAAAVINRLGKGLLSEKDEIRAQVSVVLANIGTKFMADNRMDHMSRLIPALIEWIKFETIISPAYKPICDQLKGAAQNLILNHHVEEGNQILKPFHLIYSGTLKKAEEVKNTAASILQGVASNDILHLLLEELRTDENNLREQALNSLAILGVGSAGFLLDILDKLPESKSPGTLKEKIQLQEHICTALGRIGSQEAIPALNSIVERKDPLNIELYNKEVQIAAKSALELITQGQDKREDDKIPGEIKAKPPEEKGEMESGKIEPTDDELVQQLKLVDKHVENKDTGSAVKILFDMIVKYAKQKDFEKADVLRDKLLEVDPMALTEIVKSGEIIEKEKSEAIDKDRLETWSELYGKLNEAETHALYFAMKSAEYDTNHTIFQQGESNSRLYFINKGKIKLVASQDGEEFVIKELGQGDIMGQDTFFSLTVCTISAITLSEVELDFLEKDLLAKWGKDFPGLSQKINDHCLKLENISEILNKQGKDRRSHKRINISGRVSMKTLDSGGTPVGKSITGALADISMGGVSFFIKISKDNAEKTFLEPRVNIKSSIKAGDSQYDIDQNSTIVAMIPHLYDYSVHIKFDTLLDEKIIQGIKESTDKGDQELEILTDP